jgi:hypothetical protein
MKLDNKLIQRKITQWQKKLKLNDFVITFVISEDSNQEDIDTQADIDVSLSYLRASITFYSPAISENQLDDVIIHELLHILFEPVSSLLFQAVGRKFEQLATDNIESTIEKIVGLIRK